MRLVLRKILTLFSALFVLAISGCTTVTSPTDEKPNDLLDSELIRQYGNIDPRLINPSLQKQALERMYVPLAEIPRLEDDNNKLMELLVSSDFSQPEDSQLPKIDPRKAYLQGKSLIKEAVRQKNQGGELFQQAIDVLLSGIVADPNNARLHEQIAQAYIGIGRQSQGLAHCRIAVRLDPNSVNAPLILGAEAINQGKYLLASTYLRNALAGTRATADNPQTGMIHMHLASALYKMDYLQAAAQQFQLAWQVLLGQRDFSQANISTARMAANAHVPLLMMAHIYVQMGRIHHAFESIEQGRRQIGPQVKLLETFIHSITAKSFSLQIRYNQLVTCCRYLLAARHDPKVVIDAFYQACDTLSKHQDYLKEIEIFHYTTFQQQPLLSLRLYAYGLTLADLFPQARAILESPAMQISIQNGFDQPAEVAYDLANIYGNTRQWPQMLIAYMRYWQYRQDDFDMMSIIQQMNRALIDQSDITAILQSFDDSSDISSSWRACFLAGNLAQSRSLIGQAETFYRKTLELTDNFPAGRHKLIEILIMGQKYDEVLLQVAPILAGPDQIEDSSLWYYAGQACAGLEQWHQAFEYLDHYISIPDIPFSSAPYLDHF